MILISRDCLHGDDVQTGNALKVAAVERGDLEA
jgi:hypothetical protein